MYLIYIFLLFVVLIIYDTTTTRIHIEEFDFKKTFSNTQSLGANERHIYDTYITKETEEIFKSAPRIDYPNLETSIAEIKEVKKLQKTMPYKKHLEETKFEMDYKNVVQRFDANDDEIQKIIKFLHTIADPIIMKIKVEYDRVRPSYLDPTLKPWIDVPLHPSYPSGHATQSYCIAYLLSKKYPEKKQYLEKIAYKIAKNREISGVHYTSDTKYGKILAKHITDNSSFRID